MVHFHISVAFADFGQPNYAIQENFGPLLVCLSLNGAVLERPVNVFISTSPITASRKSLTGYVGEEYPKPKVRMDYLFTHLYDQIDLYYTLKHGLPVILNCIHAVTVLH